MKQKILISIITLIGITMIAGGIILNYNYKTDKKETSVNENNKEKQQSEYVNEPIVYDVHDLSSENVEAITKLVFTYNNKSLVAPFTLKDMENIGISFDDHFMNEPIASGDGMGNIDGTTRFTYNDNLLHISVVNNTDTTLYSMDCVVDYISTSNTEVTINGITPGTSTYENILKIYGRDNKDRMNLFVNENKRQIKEGSFTNTFSYSSQNENFEWVYLNITLEVDNENNTLIDKVKTVTYKK